MKVFPESGPCTECKDREGVRVYGPQWLCESCYKDKLVKCPVCNREYEHRRGFLGFGGSYPNVFCSYDCANESRRQLDEYLDSL